jgi:hypothetical protein
MELKLNSKQKVKIKCFKMEIYILSLLILGQLCELQH